MSQLEGVCGLLISSVWTPETFLKALQCPALEIHQHPLWTVSASHQVPLGGPLQALPPCAILKPILDPEPPLVQDGAGNMLFSAERMCASPQSKRIEISYFPS